MRINRCGGSIMAGNGIWNKAFISLFCVNGLISLSQMMMNVLIALFADELGADTSLVGFAVSSFAYTALALKLISAPPSTRSTANGCLPPRSASSRSRT